MKLVIFDFDGVIVNTFDMAFEISSRINPELDLETYRGFFRGNFYSSKLKDEAEVEGTKISFFDEYSNHIQHHTTEDMMKAEIEKLSKKYKLSIVSSTISPLIQKYLERENLLQHFSAIYGSDVERSKVIKIKRLLEENNLSPQDAIFITDTTGDIKEGREAGVESIGVTWGYLPKEELVSESPFAVIDDPARLSEAVDKYFERSNLKA